MGRRTWQRVATVRVRTTVVATVVVGLALVIGAVSLVLLLRRSQVANLQSAAMVRASEIAGLAAAGRLPNPIAGRPDDASLVQVVDGAGRVVAASENIVGEPRLTSFVPAGNTPALTTLGHLPIDEGGAAYRVVALQVQSAQGPLVVYVAVSMNGVDESVRQLAAILVAGLPLLLFLVGATTWVMVGRAFRPVERMRREVSDLSVRDLGRRVPVPPADDEVGRLARTMNTMLERLQRATERERAFVADASHELRSPVAAMRAQLEVTRADPELLDEVVRMEGLIENLLLLARTDARATERTAVFDFDDVVLAEVARARASAGIPIRVGEFQPARVRGDGAELGRAVRNLLENAQRHATSSVVVDLAAVNGSVQLAVVDDGRGIAPDDRERVFERFTRLDDARDRHRGGAGLGLAIVRDVLRAHGGDAVIEQRAGGGARFVVTLPAAGLDG